MPGPLDGIRVLDCTIVTRLLMSRRDAWSIRWSWVYTWLIVAGLVTLMSDVSVQIGHLSGFELPTATPLDVLRITPLALAARRLWPRTLLGFVFAIWFWQVAPGAVWFWAPFVFELAAAVPLTTLSAHPALGRVLGAAGLCSVPEELARPGGAAAGNLFLPFAPVSVATGSAGIL